MLILFSFVLQAVSYEFQNKLGNLLGTRTFQWFLVANGILGPLLLGGAVATFFNGSNFVVAKDNKLAEVISANVTEQIKGIANAKSTTSSKKEGKTLKKKTSKAVKLPAAKKEATNADLQSIYSIIWKI